LGHIIAWLLGVIGAVILVSFTFEKWADCKNAWIASLPKAACSSSARLCWCSSA